MGMSQNVRPGGRQIFLSIFSIHHPTIGVLNFDPYPNRLKSGVDFSCRKKGVEPCLARFFIEKDFDMILSFV